MRDEERALRIKRALQTVHATSEAETLLRHQEALDRGEPRQSPANIQTDGRCAALAPGFAGHAPTQARRATETLEQPQPKQPGKPLPSAVARRCSCARKKAQRGSRATRWQGKPRAARPPQKRGGARIPIGGWVCPIGTPTKVDTTKVDLRCSTRGVN